MMQMYVQYADGALSLVFFLQAFLWLPRQGEALYEDLSVQSSDGQKVKLLWIDVSRLLWFGVTDHQTVYARLRQLTKLKSIAVH